MDSNQEKIIAESQSRKKKRDEKVRKLVEALNSPSRERTNKTMIQKIKEEVIEHFETIKDNLNENVVGRLKYKIPLSLPPATTIILPLLIGILAYFICCFCGQDECYGPVLLALPVIISKKAFCWTLLKSIDLLENIPCEEEKTKIWTDSGTSGMVVVFQEDESKFNLLFPMALAALLGILLISAFIFGLAKLMKKQKKDQTLLRINEDGKWVYGGEGSSMKVHENGGPSLRDSIVCERKTEEFEEPCHK